MFLECAMCVSTDPNIVLPIGLVFGGVTVLFIISVTIYYLFKVDIVLWFRSAFPVLYTSKGNILQHVST